MPMFESTGVGSALSLLRPHTSLDTQLCGLRCSPLGCRRSTEPLGAEAFFLYLTQCPSSGRHLLSNSSSSPLLSTLLQSGVTAPSFVPTCNFTSFHFRLHLPDLIVYVYVGSPSYYSLLNYFSLLYSLSLVLLGLLPGELPPYKDWSGGAGWNVPAFSFRMASSKSHSTHLSSSLPL